MAEWQPPTKKVASLPQDLDLSQEIIQGMRMSSHHDVDKYFHQMKEFERAKKVAQETERARRHETKLSAEHRSQVARLPRDARVDRFTPEVGRKKKMKPKELNALLLKAAECYTEKKSKNIPKDAREAEEKAKEYFGPPEKLHISERDVSETQNRKIRCLMYVPVKNEQRRVVKDKKLEIEGESLILIMLTLRQRSGS